MRLAGLLLAGIACTATATPAVPPPNVTIVAHRGLADGVPENTLAAFRRSIARGVEVIEIDLRLTKDGQLVVMHDATLDRTTDCAGRVAAMDLTSIKRCDAGNGERVPTFVEVIALIRDKPVRLLADVKQGTPLDPVLRSIRDHRAEAKIILGLRTAKQIASARSILPGTTILAFMPRAADAHTFGRAGAHIVRLWSDWVEADPALVGRTRGLGPQVWVMTGRRLPRRERDWRKLHARMVASGAQGLITDRPDLISRR